MSNSQEGQPSRSRRWLLGGTAAGLAAVGGAAALRTAPARAATATDKLNVLDYGAVGDGQADDTAAINAALSAAAATNGNTVFVPPGTYKISAALQMSTGIRLVGASRTASVINQTSTTAHALYALNQRYITVRDLTLQGPGSGTGSGIFFDATNLGPASLDIQDLTILSFGGDGMFLNTPITSTFSNIRCQASSGAYAFHTINGTSLVFSACYANGPFRTGYYLDGLHYSALLGCAADGTQQAYYLNNCQNVTLTGCGCESNTVGTAPYLGYGFVVNGGVSCALDGCRNRGNPSVAFWVTGSAGHTTLTACEETAPASTATASFKVDAGSGAVLTGPGWTTPAALATNTTYMVTPNGAFQR